MSATAAPRRRPARWRRRLVLAGLRVRRFGRRSLLRLALLSGWAWVAAGSLIGFEALELLFGAFLMAPELLPIAILLLALLWYFRERLLGLWHRIRRWLAARPPRPRR